MSRKRCLYVEYKPGQWYYFLERWNAPEESRDWREYADVVGPFRSEHQTRAYLLENNAIPITSFSEEYPQEGYQGATLHKLISEKAKPPKGVFDEHK